MYKNIIYITGNNSYAISAEVTRWRRVFEQKYGKENIDRFPLDDRTRFPLIRDNLLSGGLFIAKRLFIFSWGIEKKSKWWLGGIETILEAIKDDIPLDHFLLFHHISIKEEWLIGGYNEYSKQSTLGWLQNHAEVRKLDTLWDAEYWAWIFPLLEKSRIQGVLREYKEWDATRAIQEKNLNLGHLIAHSFEMMSILVEWGNQNIDTGLTFSEWGYNIFQLTDTILEERYDETLRIFQTMTEHTKTTEILPSLVGNLRNSLYIKYLISCGKGIKEIERLLPIHPFVLKKNLQSMISWKKIWDFYRKLISIDRAYKSGKWLQDSELWRIFSINLAILELKK
jgi:hypothetical protein